MKTAPKLRRWFAVGFALVFIGLVLGTTRYVPYGDGVALVPLWRYYWIMMPRAFTPQLLGLFSPSDAFRVAGMHLAVSAAVGLMAMGVGWGIGKLRLRSLA
jgi:hypothetical protein